MNKHIDTEITGVGVHFIDANGKKTYGLSLSFTENGGTEVYVMPVEELLEKVGMVMDMFGISFEAIEDYIEAIKGAEERQEMFSVLEPFLAN